MTAVTLGKKVRGFRIESTDGTFRLADHAGQPLVLYFYPRDNTPGCTREGQDFATLHARFRRAGAVILGVSTDTLAAHERFRARFKFPFHLGSDPEHALAERFGAWREKNMYGRKLMGIERSTFLIGADGKLQREWRKVKVTGHAEAVLTALREDCA